MQRLAWMVLAVIVAGCAAERTQQGIPVDQETVTPDATASAASRRETRAAAYKTATPTLTPTATATANPPASLQDSWIVFLGGAQGSVIRYLWAVRPDGSNLTQLVTEAVSGFAVKPIRDANGEVLIAYVAAKDSQESPLLKLLRFPSMEVQTITPLLSADTILTDERINSEDYLIYNHMHYAVQSGMKWSPDGRWLAFLGAINGLTTDVYTYDLIGAQVRWLTSGEDHANQLLWSPDSRWILHTSTPEGLIGRSGGGKMNGVWAATPDGGSVIQLEGYRATNLIGWIDDETVLADHGPDYGAATDLRMISLSGEITEIAPDCYASGAYNLEDNIFLIGVNEYDNERYCEEADYWDSGLYLVSPEGAVRISDKAELAFGAEWSSYMRMFLHYPYHAQWNTQPIGITLEGAIIEEFTTPVPPTGALILADGDFWLWLQSSNGRVFAAFNPDYEPKVISGDLQVQYDTVTVLP